MPRRVTAVHEAFSRGRSIPLKDAAGLRFRRGIGGIFGLVDDSGFRQSRRELVTGLCRLWYYKGARSLIKYKQVHHRLTPPRGNVTKDKRKYHSPLRQKQAAQTRQRIIAAGSELVHGFQSWDWKNLTAKAVGERAGVSERTVQRHFSSERALRDAVLQGLVEESGVDLAELSIGGFDDVVSTMFRYLSSFAVEPEIALDPSQTKMDQMRKLALVTAVADATPTWSRQEQEMVAAILDMLWQPATHDRLKVAWDLDADSFTRVISWFTALVQDAVEKGNKP